MAGDEKMVTLFFEEILSDEENGEAPLAAVEEDGALDGAPAGEEDASDDDDAAPAPLPAAHVWRKWRRAWRTCSYCACWWSLLA